MRSMNEPTYRLGYASNRVMLLWALAALALLLVAVPLPFLHDTLKLQSISLVQWALVVALAFIATFWMEARKIVLSMRRKKTRAEPATSPPAR